MEQGTPLFISTIKKKRALLRILALAMMVSVIAYMAVAYMLSMQAEAEQPPTEAFVALRLPLGVLGILIGLASIAIRMAGFSRERMEARLAGAPNLEKAARNPQTRRVDTALLEQLKTLSEHEQKIIGFITWYQAPYIVMLALSESVALFGLVLAILARNPFEMLPFAAVSLFLIVRTALHPNTVMEQAESILQRMNRSY